MTRLVISSGHSHRDPGAVGVLRERDENVRVTNEVARLLRANGAEVHVFHDNTSASSAENLRLINAFHNGRVRDLDASIHFNAFQKTDRPMGTEVLYNTQQALAARVSAAISQASGLINRGAKHRTNLSFLNNTNRPAILIEVCFVDSSADVAIYRAKFNEICQAIANTLHAGSGSGGGATTTPPSPNQPMIQQGSRGLAGTPIGDAVRLAQQRLGVTIDGDFGPMTRTATIAFQRVHNLTPDGVIGPRTWAELLR